LQALVSSTDGFKVVAVASDGGEALELVGQVHPEICILDVRMPELNGLEVLERIREEQPRVRCIIYSGHDDFEFAQSAIKLKADDYLLKPASPQSLRDVLLRLRRELEAESLVEADRHTMRHQLEQGLLAVEEVFYRSLISGEMSLEELEEKRAIIGIDVDLIRIMILSIDDAHQILLSHGEHETRAFRNRMKVIVQSLNHRRYDHRVPLLTVGEDLLMLLESAQYSPDYAKFIKHEIHMQLKLDVTIAVGDAKSLSRLSESYQSARDRLAYRLVLGGRHVITDQDDANVDARDAMLPASILGSLKKSVRYIDRGAVDDDITTILLHFRKNLPNPNSWRRFCFQIYQECHFLVKECVPDLDDHLPSIDVSRSLHTITSAGDLEQWLRNGLNLLMDILESRSQSYSLALKKTLDYIDRNFKNDFSLTDLALHVQLNPSYLSSLISRESGKTFVEHVTQRRVEEAKKFLVSGDHNVSEIAYLLGYETPRYFSMVFRKNTGLTPSAFRQTAHPNKKR